MDNLLEIIRNHKELNKDFIDIKDVQKDGNCYYRTLSLYFTDNESKYPFFRHQIYLVALNDIDNLKEFFIDNVKDLILENNHIDAIFKK